MKIIEKVLEKSEANAAYIICIELQIERPNISTHFSNFYSQSLPDLQRATPCLFNALPISPSYESSASHFLSSKQYPLDICRISQPEV